MFAGGNDFSLKILELLGQSNFELKGLITAPPAFKGRGMKKQSSPAGLFALREEIPLQEPENLLDKAFLEALKAWSADFLFVCSYGKILPLKVLSLFPRGALNLHLSLLPLWRGAAPVQRALMAGASQTGLSLQQVAVGLDEGDILGQRAFALAPDDNTEDVYKKALEQSPSLLSSELKSFLKGKLKPRPQDHTKRTYASKIKKAEARIVWQSPAQDIHNQIRGLFSGPQAFSFLKGKRIKIFRSQALAEGLPPGLSPGELFVKENQLFCACAPGALKLLELQEEGKKRLKAQDFLKGRSFLPKAKLGEP